MRATQNHCDEHPAKGHEKKGQLQSSKLFKENNKNKYQSHFFT